ncbi:MAG: hypothetical protein A2X86_05590 [Bdellovibrionales bacterium GWA2_49_15]|nr:MAG: hypothetical protein A2X86_05590 [Bdellovibrionales bacterium GWA2_49_15]
MKNDNNIIANEFRTIFKDLESTCSLFIVQEDGTLFFPRKPHPTALAVGALVSGVWLASNELAKQINLHESLASRLSFDSSDSGIHILPLKTNSRIYFMAIIYSRVVNPGLVKNQARILRDRIAGLDLFLGMNTEKKASSVLFENISDDEVNKLFSNIGI